MLRSLAVLLICQLIGEAIARGFELPLPGPVIGLMLLVIVLLALAQRGRVDPATIDASPLGNLSNGLLANLGVLFVPAGVGVIQQLGLLDQYGLAILAALLISTVLTLIVTVWVFVWATRLFSRAD
jgi:putative effector of murein hydrolase LrgA (UPF0299 family)